MSYKTALFLIITCLASPVFAEKIIFKQTIEPKQNWIIYALTLLALLAIVLRVFKKANSGLLKESACRIIERKRLSHKICIYVLEYQNQRFILADNQQALTIQALKSEAHDE